MPRQITVTQPAVSSARLPRSLNAPRADLRPAYMLGGAIKGAGKALADRAEELKKEYDTAKVITAYYEFLDENRKKLFELKQREGEAAYGAEKDYESWFNKTHGEFMTKRFDSTAQQELFDKHAQAERQRALDEVADHIAVEHQRFKKQALDGLLINTAKESSVADEADSEGMIENYKNAAIQLGKSPAEIVADIRKIRIDRIENMLVSNPQAVPDYINRYKGEIGGEAYNKYTDQAKSAIKQQLIDNVQAKLQMQYEKNGIPDVEGMRKELTHMDTKKVPYDVKFEVRQYLDALETQWTNYQSSNEKKAHDEEERQIGMLFLEEKYAEATNLLRKSKFLKGGELKTWYNAIKKAQKGEETRDPIKETAEIVIINRMIRSNRDAKGRVISPNEIKNHIIQAPISRENKEQYINKLESDLSGDMKKALKFGEDRIETMIIPQRSNYSKLLKAPIETQRVMDGQRLLTEWLDREVVAGRYPSLQEVDKKAIEIGTSLKPTQAEIIEDIKRERAIQSAAE